MKIQVLLSLFSLLLSFSLLAMLQPQPGYGVLAKMMQKPAAKPKPEARPLPSTPAPSQPAAAAPTPIAVPSASMAPSVPAMDPTEILFVAVFGRNDKLIIETLEKNPQVNAQWQGSGERMYLGQTPLMIWVQKGWWHSAKNSIFLNGFNALIMAGADINARNSRDGKTALHYVSKGAMVPAVSDAEMWDFLVQHGANPDVADSAGQLPVRPDR